MLPKGYRTNIKINQPLIGPERRQELVDIATYKDGFLPKGVYIEDMDKEFIKFVDSDLNFTVGERKIPVIFLTLQRWSEFSKTWKFTDEYNNVEMPFITIVRKPSIQEGTNQAGLWNIPVERKYTICKVPTWDGNRKGVDLYKIPQPTAIDLTYEVRLFTTRTKDINLISELLRIKFQSKQHYINVNGHPMPLYYEDSTDEGNIDDFENRRFYILSNEFRLAGYLLDEKQFEVVPTINRIMLLTEVVENDLLLAQPLTLFELSNSNLNYSFVFKPNSSSEFSYVSQYDKVFTQINNLKNISRIIISVNDSIVFDGVVLLSPINISKNDVINIKITKPISSTGSFDIAGYIL